MEVHESSATLFSGVCGRDMQVSSSGSDGPISMWQRSKREGIKPSWGNGAFAVSSSDGAHDRYSFGLSGIISAVRFKAGPYLRLAYNL